MRSKMRILSLVAALVVALCGGAFAAHKDGSKQVAVGTITSMDNNQVVINEKVNGKDHPMTFKMNSSTKKIGNVSTGSAVRIQYRTEKKENIATAAPDPGAKNAKAGIVKKSLKTEKSS